MIDFSAELILKSINRPILLIGPDQRVSLQNEAMTQLLRLDFTGRNYVTALRQPAIIGAIDAAIKEQIRKTARYAARTDGMEMAFQVSIVPQNNHLLVLFEDQTAAQVTDTMRRDFVANVSHELRTPLTALLGFIETLQGPARNDPKAQERFLGIMAVEADRLRRLVDDLLSLSRVEETERSRPTTCVDLGEVARQAVDLLGPIAADAGTHLKIEVHPDAGQIPGDDAQLQQVLNNLIENGIKYGATADGIAVKVHGPAYETALRQSAIRVTVEDKGQGIPAHHLVRLTERFYRIDDHRDREMGGTGLGLAIVKHIIQRHRGKLIFESVEGQGTTANVLLPTQISSEAV